MTINQHKAIEQTAQALAKIAGRDYSDIRMTDHYLRRKRRPDPVVAGLVAQADAILRPFLDNIVDLEDECALLRLRIKSCHEEARSVAEYIRAIPGRLPSHLDQEFGAIQFRTWLTQQIEAVPLPYYAKGERP
ncbi:hypothetical protein GIW56_22800 [Pseudomonas gessardii]|uniref:Uncharacterized protein n=1 Tax=Pseudomonas gessardii TaxID=78544 RepID=A0ABS9FD49_9PSED|nr:hypothetical protein [Pseudomonas gessardii]MCF4980768.1 hypothetical protein [Pseudomonas gessardii]MCF4988487.1 hypothetical protein [Pseudomonas gessardii]MCF5098260.1 hypothetical protein [Pseudomonas gessardii]MCF5098267.1 hypothetical protein [Pseudomonas gessardii]MCF5109663.1 hypothetical protein [Pseudomonas gessardii]